MIVDLTDILKTGCQEGKMIAHLHTHPMKAAEAIGSDWPFIEYDLDEDEVNEQWDDALFHTTAYLTDIKTKHKGMGYSEARKKSAKEATDLILQGHSVPRRGSLGEATVEDIFALHFIPKKKNKGLGCSIAKSSKLFCYRDDQKLEDITTMIPESGKFKDKKGDVMVNEWFLSQMAEYFLTDFMDKHVESYMEQL